MKTKADAVYSLALTRGEIGDLLKVLQTARVYLREVMDSSIFPGEKLPREDWLHDSFREDLRTYRDAGRLMKLVKGSLK